MTLRAFLVAIGLLAGLLGGVGEAARASVGVAETKPDKTHQGEDLAVWLIWIDDGYYGREVTIVVKRGSKTVRSRNVVAQGGWGKAYRMVKNPRAGQVYKIYLYGGGWSGFSHRVRIFP